jgi:hypothetical protein
VDGAQVALAPRVMAGVTLIARVLMVTRRAQATKWSS